MGATKPSASNKYGQLVSVAISLMACGWVADAAVDAYFQESGLFQATFFPNPHEIAIRALFLTVQLLFLLYIVRNLGHQARLTADLEAARERAETEKQKSEAILEELGDGISIQDAELKILYQNRTHRERMGEHLGEYCYRAYQQRTEACPDCHLLQSFADGRPHLREASAVTAQGLRHSEIISTPLHDGNGRIVAGIEAVRDVTDRRQMEEEIRRMNRDLGARALALDASNRGLEAFSYSLSHDIRSYLTRIYASAQALEAESASSLEKDERFLLQTIIEASEGLEELIEAMLTLARVSRREMSRATVDLSGLATLILGELARAAPEREVTASVSPGLTVEGDPQLLKIALENLLGNAWKYTRDSERPRIEFGKTARDGRPVYFVADNGVGFDPAEAGKLFVAFQRLTNAQSFAGTGIGLTTVQRIVQRHGGEIWAEATPGGGATFFFTLA